MSNICAALWHSFFITSINNASLAFPEVIYIAYPAYEMPYTGQDVMDTTTLITIVALIPCLLFGFYINKVVNFFVLIGRRTTPVTLWMNGISAGLLSTNDMKMNRVFGGVKRIFFLFPWASRRMLYSDWGVSNKADAMALMATLTSPLGLQNAGLQDLAELHQADQLSEADFLSQFQVEENSRDYKYLQTVHRARRRFGDNAAIGWDYSRAVFLYGQCYVSRFMSYEEALEGALALCQRTQKIFNSWDEFNESYMEGMRCWVYGSDGVYFKLIDQRIKLLAKLKSKPNSPFQLPWQMELKRDW